MVTAPVSAPCLAHPERTGFAVCMSCRAVLCQECATTYDGINFCRACLDSRRGAGRRTGSWSRIAGHALTAVALVALLASLAWLMAWISTLLARLA